MFTAELGPNVFDFTDDQIAMGRLAHRISRKFEGRSFSDRDAQAGYWKEMLHHGFGGLYIPEEHGGLGQDLLTLCIVMEQSAAGGWPAQKMVLTQSVFSTILIRNGSTEQKQRWLPGITTGENEFCFALTEAGAGSNTKRMSTIARRKGQNWILNGEKTYISGVDESNFMLIAARCPELGDGISLFVIENPRERISHQPVTLSGMQMYERQFTLYIDDLEVPPENVIGEPGKGFKSLFDGLNPERLLVASQSVGLGRWGVAKATAYACERRVFSNVIGAHQAIQHPLAEAYAQLEAAWALNVAAARQYDKGGQAGDEANAAKLMATDAGFQALDRCVQTHGGSGFTEETAILDRLLVARLLKVAPVTREMTLNHLAHSALGLPRSY